MQVKQIMSKEVVTLSEETGLEEAALLLKRFDIRHLPVVRNDELIGLVTESDLRGVMFPAMIEDISVRDMMIADPVTVTPETSIEDAARLIYRHKIGCLPVVSENKALQGIVTVADMLAALIELMGFLSSSSRLDVVLPDRPEALEDAMHIIIKNGGKVIGISQSGWKTDRTVHLFRLQKTDLDPIVRAMKGAGFSVISCL